MQIKADAYAHCVEGAKNNAFPTTKGRQNGNVTFGNWKQNRDGSFAIFDQIIHAKLIACQNAQSYARLDLCVRTRKNNFNDRERRRCESGI